MNTITAIYILSTICFIGFIITAYLTVKDINRYDKIKLMVINDDIDSFRNLSLGDKHTFIRIKYNLKLNEEINQLNTETHPLNLITENIPKPVLVKKDVINLKHFRGENSYSFIGRENGLAARKHLNLDEIDKNQSEIEVIIPSDTVSFNPSFFMGLFSKSIKKLGLTNFNIKYKFAITTPNKDMYHAIQKNIQDGIQNVLNTL